MRAFIAYSIGEPDAHMVYELGDLLKKQGYEVEYNYDLKMGQRSFDEVAVSSFFVALVTHQRYLKEVVQLWQYAMGQGIPAVLLVEDRVNLPGSIAKHKQLHVFRRYMPENPVRIIELYFSRR